MRNLCDNCLKRGMFHFTKVLLSANGRICILGEIVSVSPVSIHSLANGDIVTEYKLNNGYHTMGMINITWTGCPSGISP